jgi:4-amino-4-deoxy-L-arabinose transferase-like glycosyltransferase
MNTTGTFRSWQQRWPLAAAIALYWILGIGAIVQKPGLQYDEAQLVAGAVHMRHSAGPFDEYPQPHSWVCPMGRCIPLMSATYVGAVKEYVALPLFALFGPRAPFVRLASLILSTFAIWGIYALAAEFFSAVVAAAAAFIIAINPAFLTMTVFDNNAIGAVMAGLGLTCFCLAVYRRQSSFWAAFALGLALGFAVWARANIAWIWIAGFAAVAIVLGRRILLPAKHWIAILLGGLTGGSPFLMYQWFSNDATWKVQHDLSTAQPWSTLLPYRLHLFAEMLLSEGEHRGMWAGPPLPHWQLWLFPILVTGACAVCLFPPTVTRPACRLFSRALALTFAIGAAFFFFSRLPIAEHHFVLLLPLGAVMVATGFSLLIARCRWARAFAAGTLVVYVSSAAYWQVASIRGLRATGGIGAWSDAVVPLAGYLDQNYRGREIQYLDWGLRYNVYVLADGRLKGRDIYAPSSEDRSLQGRPWIDEIRDGGVFVVSGTGNRAFANPTNGFLRALADARPRMRVESVAQRNGEPYASVLEITPDTIRGRAQGVEAVDRIEMGTPSFGKYLGGFYPPEEGGFRWTRREFSVRLIAPDLAATGGWLLVRLYIPDDEIQKLGSVTLAGRLGAHDLKPESWTEPGQHVYRRHLEPGWIGTDVTQFDFELQKSMPPQGHDGRELGVVVNRISLDLF